MSFWTAIVVIVAIGVASEMYKYRVKHQAKSPKNDRLFDLQSQCIERLEERINNLETLILEQEKLRKFDGLAI